MDQGAASESPAADERERSRHARWAWERRLPVWQQRINRFCENWIFAFIIAMAIRHFAIEAYRIPSASMEPVLYGDVSFSSADHVVVDKFLFRFTGPERWGVTVFQFPWPEVSGPKGPAQPIRAWDGTGDRSDSFPFNPLLNRNFVKRCVVKPGDEFFIAGGDLYLQQADGSWAVPRKPADVQEALWLRIYQAGEDPRWEPWLGLGGAEVAYESDAVVVAPRSGAVRFTQPLVNLYLKPGTVSVRPKRHGGAYLDVDASLTAPTFEYPLGSRSVVGSVWDYDRWEVYRASAADLDKAGYDRTLNRMMDEAVGDVRLEFLARSLAGTVTLELAEQPEGVDVAPPVAAALRLAEDGWGLVVNGSEVAAGTTSPVGAQWRLINCDNRVWVERDGEPVAEAVAVPATDPARAPTRILWRGDGRLEAAGLAIDRDLHYSQRGFLADENGQEQTPLTLHELKMSRRTMIQALIDEALRERLLAELEDTVELGGQPKDWLRPLGDGPERALRAPVGAYLLLGDNSPFSWDGRNWGWVPGTNLRGEVLAVVFPFGRAKLVE